MINLPLHKIHSAELGPGVLLFPWFTKDVLGRRRWIFLIDPMVGNGSGLRDTGYNGFHNKTVTGVY